MWGLANTDYKTELQSQVAVATKQSRSKFGGRSGRREECGQQGPCQDLLGIGRTACLPKGAKFRLAIPTRWLFAGEVTFRSVG